MYFILWCIPVFGYFITNLYPCFFCLYKFRSGKLVIHYFGLFSDVFGNLRTDLGVFYQGRPSAQDELHLGRRGVKLLAQCLKHCVLGRKGPIIPYENRVAVKFNSNTNDMDYASVAKNAPRSSNDFFGSY